MIATFDLQAVCHFKSAQRRQRLILHVDNIHAVNIQSKQGFYF